MPIRTFLRGASALLVVFAMAAPAAAQNLVRGVVLDPTNTPVEGATVQFDALEFTEKRDTKTDRRGEFLFQGLRSGRYRITASKEGVGVDTVTFTIDMTAAKQKLSFTLRSAAPAPAAAPTVDVEGIALEAAAKAKNKEFEELRAIATSAVEAQKAGKHEEAVAGFNQLIERQPTCADCYVQLGLSYYDLKRYDDAEGALKKSNEIRPTVEAYTQLARIYNTQRKFDLAADATARAADLANAAGATPAAAAGAPAGGAASSPDAPSATGGAAAAPAGGGATSETLYNRGVVLWNSGKFAEAKDQFEAAVKANPRNADALYQLGMANLNLGQIPAAREAFQGYLDAAPGGPKAAEVKTFLTQLPK